MMHAIVKAYEQVPVFGACEVQNETICNFAGRLMVAIAISAIGQDNVVSPASLAGTTSVSDASLDTTPRLQERRPRYRLRKGDAFDLDLAYSPEFNQIVAVQPDGYVTLKGVGSIFVEDHRLREQGYWGCPSSRSVG